MGLFDQFPYTNFHELNLYWILQALKGLEHTIDQFVAINALKYADPIQWNITSQYEKNTIVIDPQTGTAYISVQPVPIGVALTNPDYWTVVFDLGSFVTRAAQNFTLRWEEDTTLTATFNTAAGEWLVWGDTLYKALVNITAGDSYVVGGNIAHFTMEDIIGHLEDLTTTDKSNLVAAINEVASEVLGKIGDLEDLTTTDKSNLVAAINEVLGKIGDLEDLTTEDKSNLVAAINEIATQVLGKIGDLEDLTTEDKSNLVAAINDVLDDFTNYTISPKFHLIESKCNESGADIGDHNNVTILRDNNTNDSGKQTGGLIIRSNIGADCHHHEFGSFDIVHNLSHDGSLEHVGHYSQITNEDSATDAIWAMVGEVKDVWQEDLHPQASSPSDLCGLELDCVTHFTPENANGKKRLALSLVALGGGVADYGLFISAGNGTNYDYGKFRNGIVIEEHSLDPTLGMGIYSKSDCGSGLVMIGRTQNYAIQLQSTGSFGLAITGNYQYPLLLNAGSKISLNGITPNNNIYYDDTAGAVTIDSPAIGLANHTTYSSASAGGVEATPASVTGYIGVYINGYLKKIPYYNI